MKLSKKPPFKDFMWKAVNIAPCILFGITQLTSRHQGSDLEFWMKILCGALLVTVGILQIIVSSWSFAVETIMMNQEDEKD